MVYKKPYNITVLSTFSTSRTIQNSFKYKIMRYILYTDRQQKPICFYSFSVQNIFVNIPKFPSYPTWLTWCKRILETQLPNFDVMFIIINKIQILRADTACKGSNRIQVYCGMIRFKILHWRRKVYDLTLKRKFDFCVQNEDDFHNSCITWCPYGELFSATPKYETFS